MVMAVCTLDRNPEEALSEEIGPVGDIHHPILLINDSTLLSDLVILIERILSLKLKVGADVGVISYNETPLKKIILDGITTISSDFQMMGEKTARLIMQHSTEHIEIPFYLTLRPSL